MKYLLLGALICIAFIVGRYSAPEKVTVTHVVDTAKDQIISELNRQIAFKSTDQISTTTTVHWPNGKSVTRVKIENKNISISQTEKADVQKTHEERRESTVTVTENTGGVVVGPLVNIASIDVTHPLVGGIVDAPLFLRARLLGDILVGPSVGVSLGIGVGWKF
jgi:hypothetical protein